MRTGVDRTAHLGKTLTLGELVASDGSRTLVSVLILDVDARAVRVRGLRLAVRTYQVRTVAVTLLVFIITSAYE